MRKAWNWNFACSSSHLLELLMRLFFQAGEFLKSNRIIYTTEITFVLSRGSLNRSWSTRVFIYSSQLEGWCSSSDSSAIVERFENHSACSHWWVEDVISSSVFWHSTFSALRRWPSTVTFTILFFGNLCYANSQSVCCASGQNLIRDFLEVDTTEIFWWPSFARDSLPCNPMGLLIVQVQFTTNLNSWFPF